MQEWTSSHALPVTGVRLVQASVWLSLVSVYRSRSAQLDRQLQHGACQVNSS
jgi:hypothetical protein